MCIFVRLFTSNKVPDRFLKSGVLEPYTVPEYARNLGVYAFKDYQQKLAEARRECPSLANPNDIDLENCEMDFAFLAVKEKLSHRAWKSLRHLLGKWPTEYLQKLPKSLNTLQRHVDKNVAACHIPSFQEHAVKSYSLGSVYGPTVGFFCRDLMDCISELLGRIPVESLAFTPTTGPPYNEYTSGRQYAQLYADVRLKHPHRSPYSNTFCEPIVLGYMIDECSSVGKIKKICVFPAYLCILNMKGKFRYAERSSILVAYFPFFALSRAGRSDTDTLAACRIHHQCARILWDPIIRFRDTGFYALLSDNSRCWLSAFYGISSTDNKEQDQQCLVLRGGATSRFARDTLMSRSLIGTVVPLSQQRGSRS